MSLLNIKKMRVSFGRFMPVKGVSLTVDRGELVALVGSSGSGKSTVAMNIFGVVGLVCGGVKTCVCALLVPYRVEASGGFHAECRADYKECGCLHFACQNAQSLPRLPLFKQL